jgi:hypothetical protein
VDVQIERLVEGIRAVLGADLPGVYLHGSAVLGGLGPRSDIDVIVWREAFERGELEPWPAETSRDLASAITMALLGDAALLGPPPAEMFDPVPRRDYIDAILRDTATVDQYLPWDTRNVVLTLPRIWSAVATDDVLSKDSAAAWVLPRLPEAHRPVLERARAI